jgi:hypothetical protein
MARSRRSATPNRPRPRRTTTRTRKAEPEAPVEDLPPISDAALGMIARFTMGRLDDPQAVARWLTYWNTRYRDTKNAAFALEAIAQVFHQIATEIFPPEVAAYAVRIAGNLQTLSRTNIPTDDIPRAIAQAFEVSAARGENPFRTLTDEAHDLAIAVAVTVHLGQGNKLDFALIDVAKDHPAQCRRTPRCESLSRSTVARIWKQHASKFPQFTKN